MKIETYDISGITIKHYWTETKRYLGFALLRNGIWLVKHVDMLSPDYESQDIETININMSNLEQKIKEVGAIK